MLNYYSLLKISPDSTQEEIELAFAEFKNELLKFSPGINLSDEELRKRKPEIWEVFDVLLNEGKRKQYDEVIERERIHELYEAQRKIKEELELRATTKWKYIGLGTIIIIVIVYFLQRRISANSLSERPNWQTHYITDKVKIVLPAPVDSCMNIVPPYLTTHSNLNYISQLSDGFSVSVGRCEMEHPYTLSMTYVANIGNLEMQNLHIRSTKKQDTTKVNLTIYNYSAQLNKGTYEVDNVTRSYENYTLINGNEVIKVVVSYVPGNTEHEKYCEIVFKSLMEN